MKSISHSESNVFWRLKAIAVFTIFFAHLPYQGESDFMILLFNYLGIVGVPVFLIISGYFEYASCSSWKTKLKGLFLPLFIWGTIQYVLSVYLGGYIPKHGLFLGYFMYLYGCGTWLYFVPVLLWCKILCLFDMVWYNVILLILSLLSITLTAMDLIPYNDYFTKYTNPLNFLIYYQFGFWIKKYAIDCRNKIFITISVVVIILAILFWDGIPSYFSIWCVPFSVSAFVLLYFVSFRFSWGEEIGRMSYVVYLVHMLPLSIISKRIPFFWGTPLQIINVIVIFSIITFSVWLLKKTLYKLNIYNIIRILGYR